MVAFYFLLILYQLLADCQKLVFLLFDYLDVISIQMRILRLYIIEDSGDRDMWSII